MLGDRNLQRGVQVEGKEGSDNEVGLLTRRLKLKQLQHEELLAVLFYSESPNLNVNNLSVNTSHRGGEGIYPNLQPHGVGSESSESLYHTLSTATRRLLSQHADYLSVSFNLLNNIFAVSPADLLSNSCNHNPNNPYCILILTYVHTLVLITPITLMISGPTWSRAHVHFGRGDSKNPEDPIASSDDLYQHALELIQQVFIHTVRLIKGHQGLLGCL